ncbi:hypothetical protein HF324_07915 [Chitinophaga oryzae]|uniref:Tetrahydromethanopterin S-methyltransferase n=1 Tax=Chitinophaga oryzae TaxID=2725414 RepID=A0ABX6LCM5_9BACT|nr:hypothetical protein [Chitinophaga oryzae]QJB37781.1 hypothetical protein HF324_07915 [Chitinophaga oryzae]
MNDYTTMNEEEDDKKSFIQRLRDSVLPIKPEDSGLTKVMKQIGFGFFLGVAGVVTALLAIAVSFAL